MESIPYPVSLRRGRDCPGWINREEIRPGHRRAFSRLPSDLPSECLFDSKTRNGKKAQSRTGWKKTGPRRRRDRCVRSVHGMPGAGRVRDDHLEVAASYSDGSDARPRHHDLGRHSGHGVDGSKALMVDRDDPISNWNESCTSAILGINSFRNLKSFSSTTTN